MTCRFLSRLTIVAAAGLTLMVGQANAWGPNSQKAIVFTSLEVLDQLYHDPFKSEDVDYRSDVIQGAIADRGILISELKKYDRSAVINAVGAEMLLLREMAKRGVDSYFAYRMGRLGGLVSDVFLPYSFETDPAGQRLLAQLQADIDSHLSTYKLGPRPKQLEYITSITSYIEDNQTFFQDAKFMIKSDYEKGIGYDGYMKAGGQKLFEGAVYAVAHVWYTVMREKGTWRLAAETQVPPSDAAVVEYLVREIEYQLKEKHNVKEADKAYNELTALDQRTQSVYERIGDAYYALDSVDARNRAVQEWDAALTMNGANRERILGKLSAHYLEQGKELFTESTKPDAPSETLQLALNAFTRALEYDRSDREAANLINETQIAITERNERQQLAIQTVASTEAVLREAEASFASEQNEEALAKYEKAILVAGQVSPEFPEQAQAAKDAMDTANRMISRIIRRVLDQAQDMIDEGDRLVEDKKFEEAMSRFTGVETVLNVVPDQEGPDAEQKQKLIEEARSKVEDAERAKVQYEELQKSQAATGGAPGARPAPQQ